MLTAKEWIVYILQNELEDEPLFKDGKLLGFMTIGEAAAKFDVGMATVWVWINNKDIPSMTIGNQIFIPANTERPSV